MSDSLARRERRQLCDLALELGPDVDTLCGEWDAGHLVAHLFVREQRPWTALGQVLGPVVPPLAGWVDRSMEKALADGFASLVQKVRAPRFTPLAMGPIDRVANSLEYLVHHEDLRRAQDGWEPRTTLGADDLDAAWRAVGLMGRLLVRSAGVPVELERTDTGDVHTLRGGADPVRVSGPVVELVLFCFGRDQVRGLELTGPSDRVTRLREADRSL